MFANLLARCVVERIADFGFDDGKNSIRRDVHVTGDRDCNDLERARRLRVNEKSRRREHREHGEQGENDAKRVHAHYRRSIKTNAF